MLKRAAAGAAAWIGVCIATGCESVQPPPRQLAQVNQLLTERTGTEWDSARLLSSTRIDPEPPRGQLTLAEATHRALSRNLSLVASAENLTLAHAQLVQAGLIQNPTLGQSSGLLFPIAGAGGYPSVDGNIQQVLNSIFTQPARVSVAKLQEIQANIDFATQAYTLSQQVDGKYQEMIHLIRARRLAERIRDLYARAVRAAEARRRVGVITAPELNRARLNYEDARRQVQHLKTQYERAAREMNALMGYYAPPAWTLPESALQVPGPTERMGDDKFLEEIALSYRLDLLRAEFDRRLGARGVELARIGLFPQTSVGFEAARDTAHNVVAGPWLVSITLPIFDPGLVALQLAEAQARKADKTFEALRGQVRQDVQTALANNRIAADDVNFFRERLIPQQEENVRLSETSFRLGNDDLDTLLNVYQNYVSQLQAYEDAIQAYHDARVAMQQATGLSWERILLQQKIHYPRGVPAAIQPAATEPTSDPTSLPVADPIFNSPSAPENR